MCICGSFLYSCLAILGIIISRRVRIKNGVSEFQAEVEDDQYSRVTSDEASKSRLNLLRLFKLERNKILQE